MKQIFLFLAATAIFIAGVGILSQRVKQETKPTKVITIATTKLNVEIADTEELRQKGLSGRSRLAADGGMLFVFPGKNTMPSFWMKDMLIPLDIIWIKDQKVAQIDKGVQPPKRGTADSALTLISPKEPVDYVLEVNAGFSDKNGIILGTPVDLSGI